MANLHECRKCADNKSVSFHNRHGIPNPHSIYGPTGSYWGQLFHCNVCDRYWGKLYDTHGGLSLEHGEAKRLWTLEVDGQIDTDAAPGGQEVT